MEKYKWQIAVEKRLSESGDVLIENASGTEKKIKIECFKCGKTVRQKAGSYAAGNNHRSCGKYSVDDAKRLSKERDHEIQFEGTGLIVNCNKCGHVSKYVKVNTYTKAQDGCSKCAKVKQKAGSIKKLKEALKSSGYSMAGEYKDRVTPILITDGVNTWYAAPNHIITSHKQGGYRSMYASKKQ